ncbi:MAG: hypothetical protein LAP85_17795 [Acidobacteriia bacterium]|nr:hypothetical protein [Terriglobia bacterium]
MNRFILTFCLAVGFGLSASEQVATNFSGTWIRDQAKSDPMGTLVGGSVQTIDASLTVKQDANRLQVETRWSHKPATQTNYLLDGSENALQGAPDGLFYRAKWAANKLVIEQYGSVSSPFGTTEVNTKEEWSLSENGKILTVATVSRGFGGEMETRKQIYNRQMP